MPAALSPGFKALASKLQEAAMVHGDVYSRLSGALSGVGSYVAHTGDGETGDVIYSQGSDTKKAPYEIGSQGGKEFTNIDHDEAVNVAPTFSYPEMCDDDDNYATMEAALVKSNLYTELPLYERFISKDERKSAGDDDFAGKGRSFPILKPEDVQAAVHAMGRAGSDNVGTSTLKSRIIAIAKRKGWTQYLPKAWRGDSGSSTASESAHNRGTSADRGADGRDDGARRALESDRLSSANSTSVPRAVGQTMDLRESFNWKEEALRLIEATATPARMKVKLIQAGKGSSAFYPAEVLKRDGPATFTKGTHVYINHATSAEEAARPEGDWHKLAGALDENAWWNESDQSLYSHALFTSDYAPLIKEKAPFTGMSIRAGGIAESGKKKDGLPILKQLTHAESVDVVTRAGAGGRIFTESARGAQSQEEIDMTEAEVKDAIKVGIAEAIAAVAKPVSALETRALRGDAVVLANRQMASMNLHEAFKAEVVSNVLRDLPIKDGAVDEPKFAELITAEAKRFATIQAQVTGAGNIVGMGPSGPAETDPVKLAEARKRADDEQKAFELQESQTFASLTGIRLVNDKEAA